MEIEKIAPGEIERRSFEIITRELGERVLDPLEAPIIKRCIHTSADFDYADNLYFSPGAIQAGLDSLREGVGIVTDTQMARAGIHKGAFGGEVYCFMSDPEVAREASQRGVTRAIVCMERAAELGIPLIYAIGNAPTALLRLEELWREKRVTTPLIIAAPVGFVNVEASKEAILQSGAPCIVARGRKGGSSIAACIVNALLYLSRQ